MLGNRPVQHGGRSPPVLQVAGAHPPAVEPQLLRETEELDRVCKPTGRILPVKRNEVNETEVTKRALGGVTDHEISYESEAN